MDKALACQLKIYLPSNLGNEHSATKVKSRDRTRKGTETMPKLVFPGRPPLRIPCHLQIHSSAFCLQLISIRTTPLVLLVDCDAFV